MCIRDRNIGDTAGVTITFSEKVTGLEVGDFTVENGVLSALSTGDGGLTWTALLTPNAPIEDPVNAITLVAATYTDLALNTGNGGSSNSYAIDTKAPTLTSIVVDDTALNIGDTAGVTITFSEKVTGLEVGDFTVENRFLLDISAPKRRLSCTYVVFC